jgi:pseudouridine synthase
LYKLKEESKPKKVQFHSFPMSERVQKILSQWGVASRRQAEQMILSGRVRLNGQIVSLGSKVDPNCDRLEVDGKLIQPNRPKLIYILLNKPLGIVSTCRDPQHRPTVLHLLPENLRHGQGIHPVGRLDIDSTGALLLTNDGELTLSLTHPRYHLPKTYRVLVRGNLSPSHLQNWREGIMLEGKKTLPAQVRAIERRDGNTLIEAILTEGRNRQIRRVVQQLGFEVLQLHRTAIGLIQLDSSNQPKLTSGRYRFLNDSEICFLKNHISLALTKEAAPIQ